MKGFILAVIGVCWSIFFPGPTHGASVLPPTVVVENDWPPYFFGKPQQGYPGLVRELLTICVPQAGYSPEFQFFPVKRMYAYLKSGDIDIAVFSYRPERREFVSYGREPLFVSGYRPVVRSDSDVTIRDRNDFDTLRLGHLAGLRYSPEFYDYIEKRKKDGTLTVSTMGDSNLKMLVEGIIDVFVDTSATVQWRAKQMGVQDRVKILDYDIKTSEYFVTVSKESPRITDPQPFLDKLDSCFMELKNSGQYQDIGLKYGIE